MLNLSRDNAIYMEANGFHVLVVGPSSDKAVEAAEAAVNAVKKEADKLTVKVGLPACEKFVELLS